jgi:signal transduction histidine kinase
MNDQPVLRFFPGPTASRAPLAATAPPLGAESSVEAILSAWNDATLRLQHTHEALRSEVARLTGELEAKNRELDRQRRLADLGRMAAHVAHEVRNSLVPVTLYLSLLHRRLAGDGGSLDILAKAEAGFAALETTVNDLLNFTSHREPQRSAILARELIEEICGALRPQLEAQGIAVEIDVPSRTLLQGDRDMLRRAVLNLVLNAMDAMPAGGELAVTSFEGPHWFELEIADSGPGLSDEQLRRMFDPFFTTKPSGTGLGLAIVQRIVEAHGGRLSAVNCPQGGAALTIELPRQAARIAA